LPRIAVLALLTACCLTSELTAQAPAAQRIPLLDKLIGKWRMSGTVLGKLATYRLNATWVLQHRFIELHMEGVAHRPPGYEARVLHRTRYALRSCAGALDGQHRRRLLGAAGHRCSSGRHLDARPTGAFTTPSFTIAPRATGRSGWTRQIRRVAGNALRNLG
jgi:hypothetical protein